MYKWKICNEHDTPIKFAYISELDECPLCALRCWEDRYHILDDEHHELMTVLSDVEEKNNILSKRERELLDIISKLRGT